MRIRIVGFGMLLLLSAALMAAVQSGNDLYQQGLARETAGDIKGAIQIFERIVRDFPSNRALTARALFQLGRWSELLGQDQARGHYERVVGEYADQTEVAAEARRRLAAIVGPPQPERTTMNVQLLPDVSKDGELMAVSPDGAKAIVMDYSKGQNIALYDFSNKQTRLLTDLNWSMGWTFYAVWSADSRRVAYLYSSGRSNSFEIRVTTLDGRSSTVYRSDVSALPYIQPVGWTPDGATLVVLAARPDKTWTIGTLPATGGSFTALRSLGWAVDPGKPPRLSPDGRFVAYHEGESGLRDVHVVSLDGRDAHRITDDPADDTEPIWSSDSRRIAFKSNRLGSVSLWTVGVKDGKPTGPPVKLKDGMQLARLIDWSERGIFYDQQISTWDVYTTTMDRVTQRPTGSPRQISYSRTGRNVSPVWSPDGAKLAFVSSVAADPDRRYVVVMPADGGAVREFLIPTTKWDYSNTPYDLRWFGDGRGLGFSGRDNRGAPAVFRLMLATGEWDTIPLPESVWRTTTEWNGDGSSFYFFNHSLESPAIVMRPVNGDADRVIYSSSTPVINIRSLEFSPDRKWLAFQQWTPGDNDGVNKQILIVDVGTRETRTVLEFLRDPGDSSAPYLVGWAPSGDVLIDPRGTAAPGETRLVPVNGGAPRSFQIPILPSSSPEEKRQDLIAKWSSDGRSLALGRVLRRWETSVIENPLAAMRATAAR